MTHVSNIEGTFASGEMINLIHYLYSNIDTTPLESPTIKIKGDMITIKEFREYADLNPRYFIGINIEKPSFILCDSSEAFEIVKPFSETLDYIMTPYI